jgi:rhamnose transport system ATP-binding protein
LLLEARNIDKQYGGVRALRSVSFDLRAGEVHAIAGENGAGKSTLIKVLTGAVHPDAGWLRLNGEIIENNNPHRARELGIAAIYQQPGIFPTLTVAENIALANERWGVERKVDWKRRNAKAKELLDSVGAGIDAAREAGSLSMPEQQLVEIAKALGANARVLILDEPTASLTERETERLFEILMRLRARGVGIIYISHRLEELMRIADRVTVLRDGECVGSRDVREHVGSSAARTVGQAELIRLMAGREVSAIFPKREVPIGEPLLEVRGLVSRAAGIREVTFEVRAGEIFGLAGLVGAGRTELAETLFGLTPPDSGAVRIAGVERAIRTPVDAIRAGIAYVPEDRRRHGAIGEMPVRANTTLAILKRISRGSWLDFARERTVATEWRERLAIKTDSIDAPTSSLSGGNQQKVAIARWLATEPRVLILDEPTQGIDVGAKAECHRIMCDLAERGLAILMISSELAEIVGMSDRVGVMRGGRLQGILDHGDATPARILAMCLGHE